MQIHELQLKSAKKRKKRVGRGGKRGTYSGRGIKGQKARSGHRIPSPDREIIARIPKLRGVKFSSLQKKTAAVQVGQLEILDEKTLITKKTLVSKGIISKRSERVKILGGGKVTKLFTVKDIEISKSAREKIEKAGGSVIP